jgi:signal transduction histidine kinase/ActR/RegA family two-component response regulator
MSALSQWTAAEGSLLLKLLRRGRNTLRLRGPLAGHSTAQTLYAMLLGFGAWIVFLVLVDLPTTPRLAGNAVVDVVLILTVSAALVLLYRGSLRAASLVYLCGSWLTYTAFIILSGGIHSMVGSYYIVVSISSAWLLGYRVALGTAAVCLASLLVMAVLEVNGLPMPRYFPGPPFSTWNAWLGAMVLSAVPAARVLQILKEALTRSQKAEAVLQQHQEHLEEIVRERTAEVVTARDRAETASRSKSVFLANMSHELRSPLNTILLLSHPDWASTQNRDESVQDLHVIRHSAEHLLRLIDDVLDSARIDAGHFVVENAVVDLRELIREISDFMGLQAEQKSLDFSLEESTGLPRFISADGTKLRHVLINLLDNAIKYTEHGRVILRVDSRSAGSSGRLLLTFEIADTGVGIALQDQTRIFEPFTRVSNVAVRRGTGLGLSIVRQYLNMMGGTIRLTSVLGEGSHFFVDVPVDIAVEPENVPAQTNGLRVIGLAPDQPECRVLIVEDRAADRSILRRLLEQAGFRVQLAETGESGIEMFKLWRPHFIWMDRRLPAMDGLKATRCIRAMDDGSSVKIVGLSASVFLSEREEMLNAGLDDFVRKPYLPREILDCMERQLGVRYKYSESAVKSAGG